MRESKRLYTFLKYCARVYASSSSRRSRRRRLVATAATGAAAVVVGGSTLVITGGRTRLFAGEIDETLFLNMAESFTLFYDTFLEKYVVDNERWSNPSGRNDVRRSHHAAVALADGSVRVRCAPEALLPGGAAPVVYDETGRWPCDGWAPGRVLAELSGEPFRL